MSVAFIVADRPQPDPATSCTECHMSFGRHVEGCSKKKEIGLFRELEMLLNKYSMENSSNTPDFILAQFMLESLASFNKALVARAEWYGRIDTPGQPTEAK
jgi:hypothetical protein